MEGYSVVSCFSRSEFKCGGSLIFVSESALSRHGFQPVTRYDNLCLEKNFELSIVYSRALNLYIVCIYRSPSSVHDSFMEKLETVLCDICVSSLVILTDDWNINFLDKNLKYVQSLECLMLSYGLQMHVSECTRLTGHSAALLDYVCSNFLVDSVECTVHCAGLSDHEAVLGTFKLKPRIDLKIKKKVDYSPKRIIINSLPGCDGSTGRTAWAAPSLLWLFIPIFCMPSDMPFHLEVLE